MKEQLLNDFYGYVSDLLGHDTIKSMDQYIQHGDISCLQHCIGVAVFSLILVRVWKIKCDERSLVRGAILHDYFLYDWHDGAKWHRFHGFKHAKIALENAERDFELNDIEREIIRKHMWPLNAAPPMCKEAWVVNVVDTYCSTLETAGRFKILKPLQQMVVNATAY